MTVCSALLSGSLSQAAELFTIRLSPCTFLAQDQVRQADEVGRHSANFKVHSALPRIRKVDSWNAHEDVNPDRLDTHLVYKIWIREIFRSD